MLTGDPASDLRGLAALLALLLWPGLAVVRSPGPVVPFLSLAFWLLTWWWVPSGRERSSFLAPTLLFFALLSLLRLLKPLPPLRPSVRTLGVYALAALCLVPLTWLRVAPGLSLASLETLLVVWRQGFPLTYAPLAPLSRFGAHAPGFPFLAADVALLSGLPASRAVLLMAHASAGLLVTAVSQLLGRAGRPRLGLALGGAVTLAILVGARGGFAEPGPATLAGALGLVALSLLERGSGRSPAVAGGVLLGAAFTVQALVALPMAVVAAFVGSRPRRLVTLAVAFLLAAPRLWVAWPAVSLSEVRQAASLELREVLPRWETVPDESALLAMAWVRDHTGPLEPVCASPGTAARWLPALVGRALDPPEAPWIYRDELAAASSLCRYALVFDPFDPASDPSDTTRAPFAPRAGIVVFEAGGVQVIARATPQDSVTSFDTPEGNGRPPQP